VVKACILGVEGLELSAEERAFFADAEPLGHILFARNCETPDQVRALADSLRHISGRGDAPILIDQEGGRVARLKPPHWRAAPPAATFGRLFAVDPDAGRQAVRLNAGLLGTELAALGITVDCAPVLDLPRAGADPIIGDRAFAADAAAVAELGRVFCKGLAAAGVLPVIKHIPGHGRADADSHLALPHVGAPHDELSATDFQPFKALAGLSSPAPWAMTAHVVYEAIDPEKPATLSSNVIAGIIRKEIGFDGLLLTDDLSMEALSGPIAERARQAITAGCDVNLHCNGKMAEMVEVAEGSPELSAAARERLARSLGALAAPQSLDAAAAQAELDSLLATATGAAG
jgi:beta-N-acetylhexosaminidase